MFVDFVGKVGSVQNEQPRTEHRSLRDRTRNVNCARCIAAIHDLICSFRQILPEPIENVVTQTELTLKSV